MIAIRRSRISRSEVLVCLFLFAPQYLQAARQQDQVTMLDGTILKGQAIIVQCEPGVGRPIPVSVQFHGTTGKAGISVKQLQALVLSDGAVTLSSASGDKAVPRSVIAYLTAFPDGRSALPGSPTDISVFEALTLTCEATNHYWNGDLSANGTWAIGTQTQKIIGGALSTSYVKDPNAYSWKYQIARLELEANYGSAKKVGSPALKAQELYYGELNYSIHPSRKWSPYAMARLYHNYALGLGLGQIYGAGASFNAGGLVLSGALVGITERLYSPRVPFTSAGARIYQTYSQVLGTSKSVFVESLEVIPAFDSAKAIQGRGIAKFKIPISTRLELDPQYTDDYLRNAPLKHRQNYSRVSLSLDVKLGRTQ